MSMRHMDYDALDEAIIARVQLRKRMSLKIEDPLIAAFEIGRETARLQRVLESCGFGFAPDLVTPFVRVRPELDGTKCPTGATL
jgi:hypothetical protein